MSNIQVLNAVTGYQEIIQAKNALEQSGTDFSEYTGQIANIMQTLHPKRLDLVVVEIIQDSRHLYCTALCNCIFSFRKPIL